MHLKCQYLHELDILNGWIAQYLPMLYHLQMLRIIK
jgi:hypothetical protein